MSYLVFMITDKIRKIFWRFKALIGYAIYLCDCRFAVMIGLTYACQCDCLHCGMGIYEKSREKELSTDDVLKIINQLSKIKVKGVYFFGGEPLLRKDLVELIGLAHKRGLRTFLETNGYLLTEKMVGDLKGAGLNLISVSIDSSEPAKHDHLRGLEGLFERAITGIKNCREKGLRCRLSTHATKENLKNGDLKKIISLGEELGVNYIRILSPVLSGKWLRAEERKLNHQEKLQLKGFRKIGFVYLEEDYCQSKNKKFAFISPYGEVQPCCFIPFSFGNIKNEYLAKILKKMWNHQMFKMKINGCPMNNEKFREKYLSNLGPLTKFPISLRENEN